jgi:hypothetical protein
VVDSWDIAPYLRAGNNYVKIGLCNSACSYYWISYLGIRFGDSCSGCNLNLGFGDFDLIKTKNQKDHNTSKFVNENDKVMLRRGKTFDFKMTIPSSNSLDSCMSFQAKDLQLSSIPLIDIPIVTTPLSSDKWCAQIVDGGSSGTSKRTITVRINIPVEAAVGEYQFYLAAMIGG